MGQIESQRYRRATMDESRSPAVKELLAPKFIKKLSSHPYKLVTCYNKSEARLQNSNNGDAARCEERPSGSRRWIPEVVLRPAELLKFDMVECRRTPLRTRRAKHRSSAADCHLQDPHLRSLATADVVYRCGNDTALLCT